MLEQSFFGGPADQLNSVVEFAKLLGQKRITRSFRDGAMKFQIQFLARPHEVFGLRNHTRITAVEVFEVLFGQASKCKPYRLKFQNATHLVEVKDIL
jgi:hypothetical protein